MGRWWEAAMVIVGVVVVLVERGIKINALGRELDQYEKEHQAQ
jgi:hypothetical protein